MSDRRFFYVEYSLWGLENGKEVYIKDGTEAIKFTGPYPKGYWDTFDLEDYYNRNLTNCSEGRKVYSSHKEVTFSEYYNGPYD